MLTISSQEEFGLRFMLQMAHDDQKQYALADIAEAEGVSLPYIRKIFGILRDAGLVTATRGVNGGYMLARRASEIKLKEIFQALQTTRSSFDCGSYTGRHESCVHLSNCTVRGFVDFLEGRLYQMLDQISLSELLGEEKQLHKHLTETCLH